MKRLLTLAFVLAVLCGTPTQAQSAVTIEVEISGFCIRSTNPVELSIAFNPTQRALVGAALQEEVVRFCIPFSLISIGFDELLENIQPEECISTELGTFCRNVPDPIPGRTCNGASAGAMCTIPLAPGFGGLGGSLNGTCTGPTASGGTCVLPSMTPEAMFLSTLERVPVGDRPSTQFALQFLFGNDFGQKILALVSFLNKIRKSCAEGLGEGDLCALLPPGVCQDGFCVSFCAAGVENFVECLLVLDTVRRVSDSVQEDRCEGQGGDFDHDNVCQAQDNCDTIANQDQADMDGDGTGNACECGGIRSQDGDGDGIEDCVDPCLLSKAFGPFVPNGAGVNCGCQPIALAGQGQKRMWNGGAGNLGVPHLDALRCNFSADSPMTEGPFLLRDVTRQIDKAALPGHAHLGAMAPGNIPGISAINSQEMVTKIGDDIVTKDFMVNYSAPSTLEDKAAIDAQVGAQLFYDFLRTIPGVAGPLVSIRDPLPGPLATMTSIINPITRRDVRVAAFGFNMRTGGAVAYKLDPASSDTLYASTALDILGHEWFHGFTALNEGQRGFPGPLCSTELTTGEECRNKAHAVEEGFADGVGESFEITLITGGRVRGRTASNFIFGEDIGFKDLPSPNPRNIANPRASFRPDHVRHRLFQTICRPDSPNETPSAVSNFAAIQRECSGPFQKAYFLLARGGTFPTPDDRNDPAAATPTYNATTAPTVTVSPLGVALATRITFRANQTQWLQDRNYKHYAVGMILAAQELGLPAAQVQSVIRAYDAVGLLAGRIPSIPVTIQPPEAGTVSIASPNPGLIFPGDVLAVRANNTTGRAFAGFTIRFPDGRTSTPSGNPINVNAAVGITIEARFNP